MKRVGFFKNAYRIVRKAYFDRRTTQSEFCFEINILCDRRSVQWRAMNFELRKTALQNKLMLKLASYSYMIYLQNPIRTSSKFQCKVQSAKKKTVN